MARRILDERGRVQYVELAGEEMARLCGVDVEQLQSWSELVPPHAGAGADAVYRYRSEDDLRLARQRAAVLRTRMSIEAVRNVEAEGRLAAYAALAQDCPEGITAHVYRSYLIVCLMQQQHDIMLDAEALAGRAGLNEYEPLTDRVEPSPELARKHLRLLQAVGLLRNAGDRWEFSGLPAAARGLAAV